MSEIIKPTFSQTLTYSQKDIERILELKGIYHNYIKEGVANVDRGFSDSRNLSQKEIKEGIIKYIKENKIISDGQKIIGDLVTTHYFDFGDGDENGHSVYSTRFIGTIY